jgi:hypothetical protein
MKKPVIALLHIGYWIMYLVLMTMILLLFSIGVIKLFRNIHGLSIFAFFAFVPAVSGFYLFYSIIFKHFLQKKKIGYLLLSGILVPVICGLLGWVILYLFWPLLVPAGGPSFTKGGQGVFMVLVSIMSLNAFANGVVALVMRGFISWYGDLALKEELVRKNHEMELKLVKAQIDPHFLFNSLNNIGELIETGADKAALFLHKLSDILRFMLYETKKTRIPIAEELSYLEKYIALQQIRIANPDHITVSFPENIDGVLIEPMILIPFVENAFKHAPVQKTGNVIRVELTKDENGICFLCNNLRNRPADPDPSKSGLGNSLIERRLQLLYPGTHSLEVTDTGTNYHVKLILLPNAY